MNLHATVSKLAWSKFIDPYTPTATLAGSVRPFAEMTNSGPSTRRRVLETPPDEVMFTDRVLSDGKEIFLAGAANYDFWREEVIRIKYPVLPCDFTFKIATMLQILTNSLPSRNAYAYPHFTKGPVLDSESSKVFSAFTLYTSSIETIVKGNVVVQGSKYYRVRSDPHLDGAGFQVAEVILVADPVQSLTYVRQTGYNPSTDTITNGGSSTVTTFVEDAYISYDHTSERYADLKPGDKNITFKPTGGAPKAGETVGNYRILTLDTLSDTTFSCHCRRIV